jgi:hypothetical protein
VPVRKGLCSSLPSTAATNSATCCSARALASVGRREQPKFLGPGMPSYFNKHLPPRKGEGGRG